MAEYPIIMKQKNDQGDYDTLYPKTLGSQVEGMTLDQVSGNLASSRIDGDIPSSQITGTFPASQISYDNNQTSSIISSNQVQGAIDQLFTSVSNGKSLIAGAITDKGVSTSANDSFSQMASNIKKIETNNIVSRALAGCDFYNDNFTIGKNSYKNITATNQKILGVTIITEYGGAVISIKNLSNPYTFEHFDSYAGSTETFYFQLLYSNSEYILQGKRSLYTNSLIIGVMWIY